MNVLARIIYMAATDKEFYQTLQQDMDTALATSGFILAKEERAILREWLGLFPKPEQAHLSAAGPHSIWIYPLNLTAVVLQTDPATN